LQRHLTIFEKRAFFGNFWQFLAILAFFGFCWLLLAFVTEKSPGYFFPTFFGSHLGRLNWSLG
jgi:hypothetical protein